MGNPTIGVVFHPGTGEPMDMDKLAQRVLRPAVQASGIPWYGWHGFRRGVASNLYALGADEKLVQRILRHAKSHVTKDRYIKNVRLSCTRCHAEDAGNATRVQTAEPSNSRAVELRAV